MLSCGPRDARKVIVRAPALSITKLPVLIAYDQGLFAKYGLDVELWMAPYGTHSEAVYADPLTRLWRKTGIGTPKRPDIFVDGTTPAMVRLSQNAGVRRRVAIGGTDCDVRAHIIGRKGIASLDELKGKRIGVTAAYTTSRFHALLLAQRMGWDPVRDVSIVGEVSDIDPLLDGSVDAMVAYEDTYARALKAGLPILADTADWHAFIAGNSINVEAAWLKDPAHRETARRFMKAIAEGTAVYFQQPEIALQAMEKWYGISDREFLKTLYARGAWLPKKPYACHEGIAKTMELYDSNEMRRYKPEDFYDDSIMAEIDHEGFFDTLYK